MGTNFSNRLSRLEAIAAAKPGKTDPWEEKSFLLRVYLFNGEDRPSSDVPRHPDGFPITWDDVRRHFAGRDDVPGLAGHLLKAENRSETDHGT